jgi:hypothetical protein
MSGSYKQTIEEFVQIVNSRHVKHLDKVLADNVTRQEHSRNGFTNIQEAREYYSMEHEAYPSAQWKIIDFKQDDANKNTAQATISYNNHTYNIKYTFNSDGKIQAIHSELQKN